MQSQKYMRNTTFSNDSDWISVRFPLNLVEIHDKLLWEFIFPLGKRKENLFLLNINKFYYDIGIEF